VKGRGEAAAAEALEARARSPRDIVGRERERRLLHEALASATNRDESRLVVVRGEPGIGKSALVAAFLREAQRSGARTLSGSGDALAQSSPYHAWRPIFAALGLAESDLTAIIGRDVSAEATRDLLAQRFQRARGPAPMALVLDDAHLIDSASLSLAAEILRAERRLLLLIVTRPAREADMDEEIRRLLDHDGAQTIDLSVLAHDEAVELACRRLEVDALPAAVANLIHERAEGHPLFTEQLVQALVERGVVRVEHHECRADLAGAAPEFPETVQGLIRSRIDLLTAAEQFTLKVASVFGRTVDTHGLHEVHPLRGDHALDAQLARMARLELLVLPSGDDAAAVPVVCRFKHGLVQDVAYGMLSFEQRRRLHQSVAEWYERTHSADPDGYSTLARHWFEARVVDKSLWYLERAGAEALHAGNFREAVGFLEQALATSDHAPAELAPDLRRGAWLRQLGQACYALGQLGAARAHLERAAATLGCPVPASRIRLGVAVIRGALSPWLLRIARHRPLDPKADQQGAAWYEAASALDTVSAIYFMSQDTLATAYCLARRFELLGRLVPTDLFARCSAEMAFLWAFAGIRSRADRLFEQGWSLATALEAPLASARIQYSWSVYAIGRGDWERGRMRAHLSAVVYEQFGERRLRRDSALMEAYFDTFTGALDHAAAAYQQYLVESTQHENLIHVAWCRFGLGKIRYRQERIGEALHHFDAGLEAARGSGDRGTELTLIGVRASVLAAAGDRARALDDIRNAMPRIATTGTPSAFIVTEGYAGVAEAALRLMRDASSHEQVELGRAAGTACAALRRSARIFPAAEPIARLWTGVHHALSGRRGRAGRCWRKGLAAAQRLGLSFEERLIRDELARLER
jgi:tetratricopeptide (TPR) repeat protein